jgi:hypothetical protein
LGAQDVAQEKFPDHNKWWVEKLCWEKTIHFIPGMHAKKKARISGILFVIDKDSVYFAHTKFENFVV